MPVPQSGIPSAVGLCLESTWGVPPTTATSGNARAIGIVNTNPHRFFVVDPGGGFPPRPEVVTPHDEIDGDIELKRTMLTSKSYSGGFSLKADPEALYYILLGIFGKDVQTTLESGVYKHVFTKNVYVPSFTLEEIFGDQTYGRVSSGIHIDRVELDFARILTARFNAYAQHQIPNTYLESGVQTDYDFTSGQLVMPTIMGGNGVKTWARTASPGYIDVAQGNNGTGPLVFAGAGYGSEAAFSASYVQIDNVNYGISLLEGSSLTIDRTIDRRMTGGSGHDIGACVGNQLVVSGNLNALFTDNYIPRAALRHSKVGINLKFSGIAVGLSNVYSLEVYLPHVKLSDTGPDIPGGTIMLNSRFTAKQSASEGYSVKVTLVNTFTNASLSGNAPNAGGLGGWSAS